MNLLTEIDGHKFNIGTLRSRLANIISEARDSELRVVAMTADDLIVALLVERNQAKQQFSLAEEGLANYAQELEGAKHDIERLVASVSGEANEVERLRALLTQAPIAKVTVREGPAHYAPDDVSVSLYAPGLPPGEYDLFLMPDVPTDKT